MISSLFLRSSFGLSAKRSQKAIKTYMTDALDRYADPTEVLFVQLPHGRNGETSCVFDDTGKFLNYRIKIDSTSFLSRDMSKSDLDSVFVAALVSAGHELEHVHQLSNGDPEMTLCHFAACCNEDNYFQNYRFNRREIAAEYAGLMFARDCLMNDFPNLDCDKFLLHYVNGLADACGVEDDDRRYWIKQVCHDGFSSMNDVFSAFENAYDDAEKHVNKYKFKLRNDSKDAFAILTGAGSKSGLCMDWSFMFDALSGATDAHSSNLILAAAGMYVYPDFKREIVNGRLPDLSIQAVFGVDSPADHSHTDPRVDPHIQLSTTPALDYLQKLLSERNESSGPGIQGGIEY